MARVLGASKVTVRYQITIPASARKMLKIKEGDVVLFLEENGKIYLATEVSSP
jgi:AbrB family looped-hinge helix DNA binding protein